MDRFARIVLGYHGFRPEGVEFARELLDGTKSIAEWKPSGNDYDWLGKGVYFWEHSPERAREWAGADGRVIGAVLQLGRCFDLTDSQHTDLLDAWYAELAATYEQQGLQLPKNRGKDLKLRNLDCLVINTFMENLDADMAKSGEIVQRFQTVRCSFDEGDEAFPGAMLRKQTHIQISVRDTSCILGVFRPNI